MASTDSTPMQDESTQSSMQNESTQSAPRENDIFQAIEEVDLEAVKFFIEEKKVDVNAKDLYGFSLLHQISKKENGADIANYLVSKGADLNGRNSRDQAPIHVAALYGSTKVLKLFVDLKVDPNSRGWFQQSIMHYAIEGNKLEMVKFIAENIDKNLIYSKDEFGIYTYHNAAYYGTLEILKYLNELKTDFSSKGQLGWTILHYAVYGNQLECVKFIVESIDKNLLLLKDNMEDTPYHNSAYFGRPDILKYFIELKVDPNLTGRLNRTILHYAAFGNRIDSVKFIVENTSINLNLKDASNQTAADIAHKYNFEEVYNYLKSHMPSFVFYSDDQINKPIKISKIIPIESNNIHKLAIQKSNANLNVDIQFTDLTGTLALANVLIRKITNQKFIPDYEKKLSFMDAKISALNIVNSFEEVLQETSKKLKISFDDFDPIKLISSLTRNLINGNLNKIPVILIKAIENNLKNYEKNNALKNQIDEQLEINVKKILAKEFKSIIEIKKESTGSSNKPLIDYSNKSNGQFEKQIEMARIEN